MMKTEIVKVNILGSLMTPCGKTLALWDETCTGTANWNDPSGIRYFEYASSFEQCQQEGVIAVGYSLPIGRWFVKDLLQLFTNEGMVLDSYTSNNFIQGHTTASATTWIKANKQIGKFTSGTIHTERLTVVLSRKKTLIDILAEFRNRGEPMAILSKTFEIIGG